MLHNAQIVGFAEGSHVLMADGSWKTIEKVKEGDMVMSFDPAQADSELEPRKVTNTWAGLHRECVEVHYNNKVTVAARDQLFFTPGASWAYCFETKQVVGYDGNTTPIQTRNVRGGKWKIYDITVDQTHSFVVNDIRVHNKKKRPAPQPVVTAGRPGLPVTVTTSTRKKGVTTSTTVTVQPSPGSSAQVAVSGNGAIGIRQNSVPGLPTTDNSITYGPAVILPYPGGSYVHDRSINAQNIRSAICGEVLSKGANYRVTKSDAGRWNGEIELLINELQNMKNNRVNNNGANKIAILADPTVISEAITQAKALKKEIKAGRKITIGHIQQNCDKLASIIQRISDSTGLVNGGGGNYFPIGYGRGDEGCVEPMIYWANGQQRRIGCGAQPIPSGHGSNDVQTVEPNPSSYSTDRVYQNNAAYPYIVNLIGCQYIYNVPDAPGGTTVRYFKHYDADSARYYFDRVSNGAIC